MTPLFLVVALTLLHPHSAVAQNEGDPVASLKPMLASIQRDGTKVRVINFSAPDEWDKRKMVAKDVKYDVEKTNSLVSPYVARISWKSASFIAGPFSTKEAAEKADLPANPNPLGPARWNAELAFQDSKWVVQDVWWTAANLGLERRHSTLKNDRDVVKDWWWALGGK